MKGVLSGSDIFAGFALRRSRKVTRGTCGEMRKKERKKERKEPAPDRMMPGVHTGCVKTVRQAKLQAHTQCLLTCDNS